MGDNAVNDFATLALKFACCLVACCGFGMVFNLRGKKLAFAALGGAIGEVVFLLCNGLGSEVVQSFVAMVVIAVYSEGMARLYKVPVTVCLIVGLLPLVPGGGIYYTMRYCAQGEMKLFAQMGIHTFAVAGALALGIVLVSSAVRLRQTWLLRQGELREK